jgi:hypothetical protein
MTRCQLLAGALGLASWRARAHLEEYAVAAGNALRMTTKGTQKQGTLRPIFAGAQRRPQLSELGVTDAVLATIWRFGPDGITHEVAPLAERYYTGADIAFVDGGSRRILLYQAKMAWLSGATFRVKSELKGRQRALLTSAKPLSVAGRDYAVTGRLALYQADHGDSWYDFARSYPAWRHVSLTGLEGSPLAGLVEDAAAEGYYTSVISGAGASPCGVMAGRLAVGSTDVGSIGVRDTWPWEYDAYRWCTHQPSPLDDRRRNADTTSPAVDAFEPGDDGPSGWETTDLGDLAEFADALRRLVGPEETRRLYVVAF